MKKCCTKHNKDKCYIKEFKMEDVDTFKDLPVKPTKILYKCCLSCPNVAIIVGKDKVKGHIKMLLDAQKQYNDSKTA